MNLEDVQPIVDAVLYEGYILYPYRSTSTKNRQRWTFGGVYPRLYHETTGYAEPCHMQTQCLIEGDSDVSVDVRVRFLQPMAREVGVLTTPLDQWHDTAAPAFEVVPSLTVGDRQYQSWHEAVERDVVVADCSLPELASTPKRVPFAFKSQQSLEPVRDDDGQVTAVIQRRQADVQGRIEIGATKVEADAWRLTVRIQNDTQMDAAATRNREEASLYSFASTHTVLAVRGGCFVSLMDPPSEFAAAAAACDNQGAYPVLVGTPGERSMLLSSPIILYDYPEVAPESPGDLFDGTEIDEILSLNILAMTDDEKREMAATDPRAAELLARTEALTGDDFMRLHGVLRQPRREPGAITQANPLEPAGGGPKLAYCRNGGTELKVGDRVRLHPKSGADVMDLVLDGKSAVIEAIERDFEDRVHVAVAIDDDPGREWGLQRMPGHRFFFSPEEIEMLDTSSTTETRV